MADNNDKAADSAFTHIGDYSPDNRNAGTIVTNFIAVAPAHSRALAGTKQNGGGFMNTRQVFQLQ
jgi:hypothetical protein